MKNKQHRYICKAFIEAKIPKVIYREAPELIMLDAELGGCCTTFLKNPKHIKFPIEDFVTKEEKEKFSKLISRSSDDEKTELLIYYRLAILAAGVLMQYR